MENSRKILEKIKLFVLDMDGTIYLGDKLFDFTFNFLSSVKNSGRDFCFFTNNSSKNREAYLQKLSSMGIKIPPEKMMISNDVILKWLAENHPGKSCYVVGTPLLLADFRGAGVRLTDENPDFVVLGFDTTLTYEKLSVACAFIRRGTPCLGVNPDLNCPTEDGFIPDCGSIAALVKASTRADCEFFGKPSPHTLHYLLNHTGYRPEEMAVIGDRLYTDIALAKGSAVTSILVMSGETTEEMLKASQIQPDLIFSNLGELAKIL